MFKKQSARFKRGCSLFLAAIMTVTTLVSATGSVFAAQGDTFDKNREVSRRFTSESMVLLRNNEDVLPLTNTDYVAVFGSTQVNTQMTVFGSGSTQGIGVGFVDTLSKIKEKVKIDTQLETLYRNFAKTNPPNTGMINIDNEILSERSIPEMPLTDQIVSSASQRNEKAVIFIGRTNGEGYDWKLKDEYQLRDEEQKMIDLVTKHFDKVTVVLNTASPIDMSWDNDKIDGVIWMGICGDQGAVALTNVITGEVNPSGKLTQTWAAKYTDTPTHMNYEMTNYPEGLHGPEVEYEEDIYGGYRYYDTFNVTPKFDFGYGLSYTTFDTKINSVSADSNKVTVVATVENTGDVAGKEVVQVYYSAPDGKMEKAYQQLAGFTKTDLLKPHEKQTVTITYNTKDMASYDEEFAQYILEQGNYVIRVGNASRNTHVGAVLTLDDLAVTEQLSNQLVEAIPLARLSKAGVAPYSYVGEAAEIAAATKIALKSADFITVNNANTITDEPAELAGSVVDQAFLEAAKQELSDEGVDVGGVSYETKATDSAHKVPGKIHCADLGVNFAEFIVNNPSGDVDGYKSVTVLKANTQMPFDVHVDYDGAYTATLRYFVESAGNVELCDQNDRQLATFALNTTEQWADVTVTGIDLSGVTQMKIMTRNDNINLNWMSLKSEAYAGVVTANLLSGSYGETISISLFDNDAPDANIHYTTDGSEPTKFSPVYSAPITVSETTTIKALAVQTDLKDSKVLTLDYTIDPATVTAKAAKPTVNFSGKDQNGDQLVALSAQAGISIFYTTNGSKPTSASTFYTGPISVAKGKTVRAVAIGAGYKYSDITQINIADVGMPTANMETLGTYSAGEKLTLSSQSGTNVYYTMSVGGQPADPTTESTKYTESIVLENVGQTTIKAVASSPQSGMSQVAIFVYNVVDKVYTLEDVYNGEATIEQVVAQMTVTELVEVVSSTGRSNRFKSPGTAYADGPLGVKTNNFTKWAAPSLLACSWDVDLFAEQGDAVGQEMVEEKIDFWLAPGINILRDPRSGRNPEYYSEDQLLTGILASSVIQNVQEHGVGCVIKHYVGNDQETHRKQKANGIVSERASREIYLKAFEIVSKTAQPWALMTTYCDVNRISTATNFELCTAIPRGEWGFEGILMTDWGCYANDGMMMYAGNDLVMPGGNSAVIQNAVINPDEVDKSDPNYTKPTTKAMLQRNVVNIFDTMTQTTAFTRFIGQPQTYQYIVPATKWITTSNDPATTRVQATAGANGTIAPNTQDVVVNTDAVLTVAPENGYIIDDVLVTPPAEYVLTGNQLTIKNVQDATAVNVTFKQTPTTPDQAGLQGLITSAEQKRAGATIGGKPGNYLKTSIRKFTQAIESAKQASANASASVMDIEQAILSLKQATLAFESQVVEVITHEIDPDNLTTIKAIEHADASRVIGSERCDDVGGGKNTTGTYKDTYLSYEVDVTKPDIYSLSGRISTNETECGFDVYVDDELQGRVVQAEATGGWQNWRTTSPLSVKLDQGTHTIKIVFIKSGINVNWFSLQSRFKEVTVTTDGNGSITPASQKVEMGTDVTFDVTPNEGYLAENAVITPQADYTLRNNKLTVKNVLNDTSINVTFRQAPTTPDFASLNTLISQAQGLLDAAKIGGQVGNYLPSTAKAFARSIQTAQAMADSNHATIMDVENAIYDLKQDITAFEKAKNKAFAHIISDTITTKIKATDHTETSPGISSEACQDEDGGRNPIYTDGGTWLSYKVDVVQTGWYNFESRVSVNTTGAGFRVYADDTLVGTIGPETSTGGWQNWVTKDPFKLKLTEGVHTIKIVIAQSGMNVNWFKIDPIPSVVVDKAELQKAITAAAAFEGKQADYTVESWATFATALATANSTVADDTATQEAVNTATTALNAAIAGLTPAIPPIPGDSNKTILKAVLDYANTAKASDEYKNAIDCVKTSFDAQLTAAQEVYNKADATQEQVNNAWMKLMNEIHKLGFQAGEKSQLTFVIEKAMELDLNDYVEAGQAEFKAMLKAAQDMLANGDAMQAEVDKAATDLVQAMFELRFKANKEILDKVLGEAITIDTSRYTVQSVQALQAAIDNGNAVLADVNATKEQVEEAAAMIEAARNGLVLIETPSTEKPVDKDDVTADGAAGKTDSATTGDTNAVVAMAALMLLAAGAVVFNRKKSK